MLFPAFEEIPASRFEIEPRNYYLIRLFREACIMNVVLQGCHASRTCN